MKTIYSDDQIKENTSLSNEITFEIGRAVGKISFAYVADEVPTGELHGSLSDIRYRIMNNPAQMYLMPVMENNILLTPHYNNTSYPADYFTPPGSKMRRTGLWKALRNPPGCLPRQTRR